MKVGSKGKMLIPTVEGESFLNCFDFPHNNRVWAKVKFNQNICFLESVSAASSVLMYKEEVQDSPRNSSLLVKLYFGQSLSIQAW